MREIADLPKVVVQRVFLHIVQSETGNPYNLWEGHV